MCRRIAALWSTARSAVIAFVALATVSASGRLDAAPAYTIQTIDYPGAIRTEARGINNHGHVIGSYTAADGTVRGFLYDGSAYRTLGYPGAIQTDANGINDAGQIVGSYHVGGGAQVSSGFLYERDTYSNVGRSDGTSIGLHDINNSGMIVGSFGSSFSSAHGFVIANGQDVDIRAPDARATHIRGISDSGKLVGYAFYGPIPTPDNPLPAGGADVRAFVFAAGEFEFLSFGGRQSYVEGIGGSDQLLVQSTGDGRFLFSLAGGATQTLNELSVIADLNDLGQIVGSFGDGSTMHGYIATPVPEPASLVVALIGVVVLAAMRLRRN